MAGWTWKEAVASGKDIVSVAKDVLFLLLLICLVAFPGFLNAILSNAGITAINGGLFTWKQQVQEAADKAKVASNANTATAASLDDVKASLTAIASQSTDPKSKAQANEAIQALEGSLSTLNYADTTLKSSLATQETILQAAKPAQQGSSSTSASSSPLQGWVYLGEVDAGRTKWMIPPQPKVSSSSPIPAVGQNITLTDDLYLRADKAPGQTFNQATINGVAHAGSTAKVLDIQPSPARNGGLFLWAKILANQ